MTTRSLIARIAIYIAGLFLSISMLSLSGIKSSAIFIGTLVFFLVIIGTTVRNFMDRKSGNGNAV